MQASDWLTLVGIIITAAIPFAGWMTAMHAKLGVLVERTEQNGNRLIELNKFYAEEHSKHWQAHSDDVRHTELRHTENVEKLSKIQQKLSGFDVDIRNIKHALFKRTPATDESGEHEAR